MKDDYTTNPHCLTNTFLFRKVGRMYFLNLGVKELMSIFSILITTANGNLSVDGFLATIAKTSEFLGDYRW